MSNRSTKWHAELKEKVLADPAGRASYEEMKLQLELSDKMKAARKQLHLTQEAVAKKMGTKKPAIARLESGEKYRSSPSISTLSRFASATGTKLKIDFVRLPKSTHR